MYYVHDITHCKNDKCAAREKCYRWLAYKELENAEYDGLISVFRNRDNETKCKDFMDVELKR